jgi:hypothetical protein
MGSHPELTTSRPFSRPCSPPLSRRFDCFWACATSSGPMSETMPRQPQPSMSLPDTTGLGKEGPYQKRLSTPSENYKATCVQLLLLAPPTRTAPFCLIMDPSRGDDKKPRSMGAILTQTDSVIIYASCQVMGPEKIYTPFRCGVTSPKCF